MPKQRSSSPAVSSNRRWLLWLLPITWAGIIFIISAQPKEALERLGLSGLFVSVAGHLTTYFILMTLLVLAFRFANGVPFRRACLISFVIVAVYGLSDEYHQSFVPGRTPTVVDWIVDLIGAAAAWLVMSYWESRRERPDELA
jgi:VanZ family protein